MYMHHVYAGPAEARRRHRISPDTEALSSHTGAENQFCGLYESSRCS